MMIRVANTIDAWISRVASSTTRSVPARRSGSTAAFSRSRRTTFSTTMMASSTSAPSAMAMPPSVMVFRLPPSQVIASTATSSDSGMARSAISVARPL
jgi:hypothetical protein